MAWSCHYATGYFVAFFSDISILKSGWNLKKYSVFLLQSFFIVYPCGQQWDYMGKSYKMQQIKRSTTPNWIQFTVQAVYLLLDRTSILQDNDLFHFIHNIIYSYELAFFSLSWLEVKFKFKSCIFLARSHLLQDLLVIS